MYTSISLDKLENDFLKSDGLIPWLWYRYIDNFHFISTHVNDKLASFLNVLSNYHPYIRFIQEFNKEHIQFLDLNVKLLGNKLSTDLYSKSTDRHQYLHYMSSHPEHTKKSIVYCKSLSLSRKCLKEKA